MTMAMQGLVRIETLIYTVQQGHSLSGDFYRPAQGTNWPVVIAVHGGGWKRGSPDRYAHWGRWLAARGIAVYAIRYRLADREEHRFPAAALDVAAAIRFVYASAGQLNIDKDRLALIGDSAGGHLVSLVALAGDATLDCDHPLPQTVPMPSIRAVIAVYGVFDLAAQWYHDQIARPRDHVVEALMGMSLLEDRLTYFRASPIAHATVHAPRSAFLITWGQEDDMVDYRSQSEPFVGALKQSGQFVRTVPIVGAPHLWIDQPIDEKDSFTGFLSEKLYRFLIDRFS